MLSRAYRLSLALGLLFLVAACAQPARISAMVVNVSAETIVEPDSPLHDGVGIAGVSGGKETSPLWKSEVSSQNFEEALRLSLQQHTMYTATEGDLTLTVQLEKLDQPIVGFDMEVTSTVKYTVTRQGAGIVFEESIVYAHTQDFSSAPLGVKRLQLANEGAIRNNIRAFIIKIIAEAKADPETFGGTNAPATS